MSPAEILDRLPTAPPVLVIGDGIYDDYVFGRVERICPEAPVPIFIPEREETRPGGALNVAAQLRALGVTVRDAISTECSAKTRYVAGQQIVLRVDRDKTQGPGPLQIRAAGFGAVVLSDYAKGWLTPELCRHVIEEANKHRVPVIVDPKGADWEKFLGCDLICPSTSDGHGDLDIRFTAALYKRGAEGMVLLLENGTFMQSVPSTARHVYDVTGAGDTVVAVVAAAVAAGASYLEAARLAALAAGYVVGEVGTTVCPLEKLKELVNAER